MNRRFFLRFLGLAPLGGVAVIVAARAAPAATTWGAGVPDRLAEIMAHARRILDDAPALNSYIDGRLHFHSRRLTEAERAEFKVIYIDPVLRGDVELLESRRFSVEEICKFMGVPT